MPGELHTHVDWSCCDIAQHRESVLGTYAGQIRSFQGEAVSAAPSYKKNAFVTTTFSEKLGDQPIRDPKTQPQEEARSAA